MGVTNHPAIALAAGCAQLPDAGLHIGAGSAALSEILALDDGNGGYRTEWSAGIHDNARVKPLAECGDPASLTCAIQELCAEKGVVAHVDVWTLAGSGKRQALCFVRTDRAAREERLAGTPGLTRFGNELLFIVELPAQAPNPR